MKNRTITVPKDEEAEKALDFDQATEDQLIEWRLTEIEFMLMDECGIFDFINSKVDVIIDDFEDEVVKGNENLLKVFNGLEKKAQSASSTNQIIIRQLLELFNEAIQRNTGVYFYF